MVVSSQLFKQFTKEQASSLLVEEAIATRTWATAVVKLVLEHPKVSEMDCCKG